MRGHGFLWRVTLLTLLATGILHAAETDSLRLSAQESMKKVPDCILPIKVVLSIKMGKNEQERKLELNGTVIDSTGLMVVSAMTIDPATAYQSFNSERGGRGDRDGFSSDVTEVMIVLGDGTEIEAKVVMRDQDLDMAFIRPIESNRQFKFVDLKPLQSPPQVMDPIYVISKLSATEDRSPVVTQGYVRAEIKGPRTYYLCDDDLSKNLGSIAFGMKGEPIGILLAKKSQSVGVMRGSGISVPIAVLRPLGDVFDVIHQIEKVNPSEKSADGTKKTQIKTSP